MAQKEAPGHCVPCVLAHTPYRVLFHFSYFCLDVSRYILAQCVADIRYAACVVHDIDISACLANVLDCSHNPCHDGLHLLLLSLLESLLVVLLSLLELLLHLLY